VLVVLAVLAVLAALWWLGAALSDVYVLTAIVVVCIHLI